MIEIVWLFSTEARLFESESQATILLSQFFVFFLESSQKEDILLKMASFKEKKDKNNFWPRPS